MEPLNGLSCGCLSPVQKRPVVVHSHDPRRCAQGGAAHPPPARTRGALVLSLFKLLGVLEDRDPLGKASGFCPLRYPWGPGDVTLSPVSSSLQVGGWSRSGQRSLPTNTLMLQPRENKI